MDVLRAYTFPGNIRELQNAIERAVTFCDGELIEPRHFPQRIVEQSEHVNPKETPRWSSNSDALESLENLQRNYVQHVLDVVDGNKAKAAEILGVTRRTLYRWLSDI